MSAKQRLSVVLCWHMHQPQYRDLVRNTYSLPWTYLHTIKDYVDMVAILEAIPEARAVVNFSPIMLEQISDYTEQLQHYLHTHQPLRDQLLAALADIPPPRDTKKYKALIKACLRTNEERLINRFPPYRRLADLATEFSQQPERVSYMSEQYLADLLVWYHLAWMGETVRMHDSRIQNLIAKGQGYTAQDRRVVLEVINELLGSVLTRYRALAETGRIELSMTPYAHPIVPLLIDLSCASDALPNLQFADASPVQDNPQQPVHAGMDRRSGLTDRRKKQPNLLQQNYPGGIERAQWHIDAGKALFRQHFGREPHGCWPSEGGVSAATLKLLGDNGFSWTASGGKVLHNSLARTEAMDAGTPAEWLYQPYRVADSTIPCFFRDDGLSDLIGFTYSKWHGGDAANNLVHHLENIAQACQDASDPIVSIILDGENAWEYYPDNAYHFLTALYEKLANHEHLHLTTFSSYLENRSSQSPAVLKKMVSGSWVYGTFSTWAGDPAKNRGWEMLCAAKTSFDTAVKSGRLQGEQLSRAERQLAVCEGSDWFWWFGDYNPAESVSDFEKLFRLHLSNLYRLLGEPEPDYLCNVVSHGNKTATHSGTMLPAEPGLA
jgi:alpha-amylase/alpha-mannosidase (GH57 family)